MTGMSCTDSPAAAVAKLSSAFLDAHRSAGCYKRELIDEIAALSLSRYENEALTATRALFTSLIEPLADSFEPASVGLYNRIFAQLSAACMRRESEFANQLRSFGVGTEELLFKRAEELRAAVHSAPSRRSSLHRVERVLVLSRVTIGADVAVTSVIVERLKQELPEAEIVIVGGGKLAELFGGDRRFRFKEAAYQRSGSLRHRLLSWLELLKAIREMSRELDEFAIIDPDSRLTQLGVFPLNPASHSDRCLFFPSREFRSETSECLAALAAEWSGALFGSERRVTPTLALKKADVQIGADLASRLRNQGAHHIATMNFGLGGNTAKQLSESFEQSLVAALLANGATVILDKGAGEEEARRVDRLLERLRGEWARSSSLCILELDEEKMREALSAPGVQPNLVVWSGRVGLLSAIIAAGDSYLGYDSAGQHIAAALGVPCIDIFSGTPSPRFIERWTPHGSNKVNVVAAQEFTSEKHVLARVLNVWHKLAD
ncbi:MAG: hypothetical protein DMF61_00055 [Blastocatellia bacterium AA13]|nr:MAG: hypothetical protein DMF61_00055 [Blastocatellia bacterium AA13]